MQPEQLLQYLDNAQAAADWLRQMGIHDVRRAHRGLLAMARSGITLDLLATMADQLQATLPRLSDPDMALHNLERFIAVARNPLSLAALFERDPESLPILLQLFSTSQHLSDLLVRDPESYDLLRLTEGQPVARNVLVSELCSEVAALRDQQAVMTALRRFKHREMLRIAYGDIIRGQPVSVVTRQISYVADAICEAALLAARRSLEERRGVPRGPDGKPVGFVVLGLGKLGGVELNYSSDIDLMFVYEAEGQTDGPRPLSNREFFQRLAQDFVNLLTARNELGIAYRVDLRLRPEGSAGPAAIGLESALVYYDVRGRTWERQAFVKARPVAGDLQLGRRFLEQLQPWIYRRYLSRADITGIKALRRRIERQAALEGGDTRNVKTGRGGIRDIEFVIQFLQLLNGGDLPQLRTGNTLEAIARLESVGCLTFQERSILEQNYAFLRKLEHRLQIMFDLQTHTLPESDAELRKLAIRMGYDGASPERALRDFKRDYQKVTQLNRQILDHLLHDAFGDEDQPEPEVDLVLDPEPSPETIRRVLEPYGFQDIPAAYRNLMALATERIPFLSTRRCRHFLAAIAPRLLQAIAATPDPDSTLVSLSQVSESLGGKGVLWELFSFNPPSLHLYVRLCATSPYLSGILTSNPGMIDELLDSLLLDKLPTLESLDRSLAELLRGASDIDPILHSFKHSNHLRVGVRDILGKEDIQNTHRALSDVAEVILKHVAQHALGEMIERYGEPRVRGGPRDGQPCQFVMLAMGKLGGREPNYHSDLDVVFLYEAEGHTHHRRADRSTTNQHFFSQVGQRIIKRITHLGPYGRLYPFDARLRPTGQSGSLAVSLDQFSRYFAEGEGQLWERQALCKARPIFGSPAVRQEVMQRVYRAITARPWQPEDAREIYQMRMRLEQTASPHNLKRARGGTMDVEFAVQLLQLQHAAECPDVLVPGTLEAISKLNQLGILDDDHARQLHEAYRFLRSIEARLRLLNTAARHDLPQEGSDLKKLAFLLGCDDPGQLLQQARETMDANRRMLHQLVESACSSATT